MNRTSRQAYPIDPIPGAAQVLEQYRHPKRRRQAPQQPGLVIELEDGVHAVAELVAQENEFGSQHKQRTEE